MLPKRYRLTRSADFRRVHAQGHSWSNRLLILCKFPNGLLNSRFGFSVSRRVGKAVTRNRVKRLLRQATRLHYDVVRPGWDVVFIARRGIARADYWAVENAVTGLLRRAQLLQSEYDAIAEGME